MIKTHQQLLNKYYPISAIDNFSEIDGTVKFYSFVKAIYHKFDRPRVLDLGAGRGAWFHDDKSELRKQLRNLRLGASHVTAADVDPAVLEHQCSDAQVIISEGLPLEDHSFEIIVSDFVFEHVDDPKSFSEEIDRVLVPGGWVCARTVNKYSYVALAASLVPNKSHGSALETIQPHRKEIDVFPTAYKLNTVRQVREAFPGYEVNYYRNNGEPAYHLGSSFIYKATQIMHAVMPSFFDSGLTFFLRKPT